MTIAKKDIAQASELNFNQLIVAKIE